MTDENNTAKAARITQERMLEMADEAEEAGLPPAIVAGVALSVHDTLAAENDDISPVLEELPRDADLFEDEL